MQSRPLLLGALFLALLAAGGCRPSTKVSTGLGDFITVREDRVLVHASAQSDAEITPTGSLTIGGDPVPVTPQQQALLREYHDAALILHRDAIATGAAGARMGGSAIRSVVRGLLRGNPENIGKEIEASAGEIASKALAVCRQMEVLQDIQDDVAAALPAFQPYATIKDVDARDCQEVAQAHATTQHVEIGHHQEPGPGEIAEAEIESAADPDPAGAPAQPPADEEQAGEPSS